MRNKRKKGFLGWKLSESGPEVLECKLLPNPIKKNQDKLLTDGLGARMTGTLLTTTVNTKALLLVQHLQLPLKADQQLLIHCLHFCFCVFGMQSIARTAAQLHVDSVLWEGFNKVTYERERRLLFCSFPLSILSASRNKHCCVWLHKAEAVSCKAYVFVNCSRWTLDTENLLVAAFLRLSCMRANDLITQHLSCSTLPEFLHSLTLRILVFTSLALHGWNPNCSSALQSADARLIVTVFTLSERKIRAFELCVLCPGNSVSCVDTGSFLLQFHTSYPDEIY